MIPQASLPWDGSNKSRRDKQTKVHVYRIRAVRSCNICIEEQVVCLARHGSIAAQQRTTYTIEAGRHGGLPLLAVNFADSA